MVENIPDNTTASRGVNIIRFGVPSSGTLQK
jgi:hypothetical protein